MGILFRGHRALKEQNLKILKRQYGGVIPFYASYTYKETPTVPYNPSTLLAKYQGVAPTQTAKSDGGDKKKLDLDIDALPNDAARFGDEYLGLMAQIEQGEAQNRNFKNTKAGQMLYSRADMYSTVKLNDLKRRREAYDKAFTNIYEKNNSSDTWVVQNGEGFVLGVDPQTQEMRFDWIPLADIQKPAKEGAIQWRPVSYKDALSLSANSTDTDLSYNLDFTLRLNEGIGMNKVLTDYIDPLFKDIGKDASGHHVEVGGQEITLDDGTKKAIAQIVDGRKDITNVPHLHKAFSTMLKQLQGTPAYNTLLGEAYKNTTTPEEADEWMLQYLVAQVEKRYDTTGESTRIDKEDLEKTWEIQNRISGGDSAEKLSDYLVAYEGLSTPVNVDIEGLVGKQNKGLLEFDPNGETQTVTMPGYDASKANQLFKPHEVRKVGQETKKFAIPLSKEDVFKELGRIDEAMLPNGVKLKDMEWKFGDYGKINGLDAVIASSSSSAYVVTLPVVKSGKGAGGIVQIEGVVEFNKEVAKLQNDLKQNNAASSGSIYQLEEYQDKIKKLEKKYLGPYEGRVEYRKFYMKDIVYHKDAAPEIMRKFAGEKPPSDDDIKAYNKTFEAPIDETSTFMWEYDQEDADHFARTTIFIPVTTDIQHQMADKEARVVVPRNSVQSGVIGRNTTGQPKQVTTDMLRDMILNTDAYQHTDYFTRKLRQ